MLRDMSDEVFDDGLKTKELSGKVCLCEYHSTIAIDKLGLHASFGNFSQANNIHFCIFSIFTCSFFVVAVIGKFSTIHKHIAFAFVENRKDFVNLEFLRNIFLISVLVS